jgi:mannose-6-phosphate isomerase class I
MPKEAAQVGQHFRWTSASERSSSGTAVLRRVLSDREEGMSPEIEDYAALWFDADGLSGMRERQSFTVVLGTDGNGYIEGQQVAIEILSP